MSKISDFFNQLKIKKLPSGKNDREVFEQYDYQWIMRTLKRDGKLDEFFIELDQLNQEKDKYYPSEVHGINHTARVMLLAKILTEIDCLDEDTQKLIVTSARYHDIGRVDDKESKEHGKYSKDILRKENLLKNFLKSDRKIIEFAVEQHSLSAKENEEALKKLPFWQKKKYTVVLHYLKDADALDRVRIANQSAKLDASRLRTTTAKQLVDFATANFKNFHKIISEYQLRTVGKQDLVIQEVYEMLEREEIDKDWILQNQDLIKKIYPKGVLTNLLKEKADLLYFSKHKELIEAAFQVEEGDFEELRKAGFNITYLSFLEIVSSFQEGALEKIRKEGNLKELFTYETFQKYGKELNFRERIKNDTISDEKLLDRINHNSIKPKIKQTFEIEYMLYRNLYKNYREAFDLFCYLGLDINFSSIVGILEELEINDLEKVRQSGCKISLGDLIKLASRFSPEEYREMIDNNHVEDLFKYDQVEDTTNKFQQILNTIKENNLEISKRNFECYYELYKELYDNNQEIYAMPEMKKYSIQEIYPAFTKMKEAMTRLNVQRGTKLDFDSQVLVDLIEFLRKNTRVFFFR